MKTSPDSLVDKMLLLNQATVSSIKATDETSIVKRLLPIGIDALEADFGYCQMLNAQDVLECVYKTPATPYEPLAPRKSGLTMRTFNARRPMFISDVHEVTKARDDAKQFMAGVVLIPITYKQDNFGILVIAFKKRRQFREDEKILCGFIGNSAAQAIALHRSNASLQEFKRTLDGTLDVIFMLHPKTLRIDYANFGATKMFGYTEKQFYKMTFTELIAVTKHKALREVTESWEASRGKTQLYETTMVSKSGQRIPVEIFLQQIINEKRPPHLLAIVRDIKKRKSVERGIRRRAFLDGLTGLANLTHFLNQLDEAIVQAKQSDGSFALLFIDLDKFKFINDVLGHRSGDDLLRQVSKRITGSIKSTDVAGRMGGDEFLILLPNIATKSEAVEVAKRVLSVFNEPFQIANQEVYINCSMGVVVYPDHGSNKDNLLQNADTALYQAKDDSGNSFVLYSGGLAQSAEHFMLDREFRRAFMGKELMLYYHPQAELSTGKIIGYEALVRWNHPELGLLLPDSFLPQAEMSGQIIHLDNFTLQTAVADAERLLAATPWPLTVSVNVSMRHLFHPDLIDFIVGVLHKRTLAPSNLKLELTESMVMKDVELAQKVLGQIKELGITSVIDDFGSGYTSINYLKRLPIDTIKIDKNFIGGIGRDRSDEAIISAMVSLAHQLDLKVVAEGVETMAQVDFLRKCDCDIIQGNILTPPLPYPKFMQWLAGNNYRMPGQG